MVPTLQLECSSPNPFPTPLSMYPVLGRKSWAEARPAWSWNPSSCAFTPVHRIPSSITPLCSDTFTSCSTLASDHRKVLPHLSCLPHQLPCSLLLDSWLQVIETHLRLLSKKRDFIDPGPEKSRSKTGSGMTGPRIPFLHPSIHLPSLRSAFLWVDFIPREAVSLWRPQQFLAYIQPA